MAYSDFHPGNDIGRRLVQEIIAKDDGATAGMLRLADIDTAKYENGILTIWSPCHAMIFTNSSVIVSEVQIKVPITHG